MAKETRFQRGDERVCYYVVQRCACILLEQNTHYDDIASWSFTIGIIR